MATILDTGALVRPAFTAADFRPTEWNTSEHKAKFANNSRSGSRPDRTSWQVDRNGANTRIRKAVYAAEAALYQVVDAS